MRDRRRQAAGYAGFWSPCGGSAGGGLLFDPNSVASIKSAILEIIRYPAAAQARAARAAERMAAMTPQRYGAQLGDLVASMAGSHVAARGASR